MTVQELIVELKKYPSDVEVQYVYDSTVSSITDVAFLEEYDWLPNDKDKTGKSLQKTGKMIVHLE